MSETNNETKLPSWLWFFLAIPLGLLAALIWQRRRVSRWVRQITLTERPPLQAPRRARYIEPDSIPIDTRRPIEYTIATQALEPAAAPAADDLRVIEGIGPKIAALLAGQGIATFQALAETSVARLNEILTQARLRQIADPGAWAEQAKLAAGEKWEELKQLQGQLKGGRRRSTE